MKIKYKYLLTCEIGVSHKHTQSLEEDKERPRHSFPHQSVQIRS